MPGLTSTACSGGSTSGSDNNSPVPRMMRARGSRQTGTSAPMAQAAACSRGSLRRDVIEARQKPQGRRRIGRAAAKPRRGGEILRQLEMPGLERGNVARQHMRGLDDEIVFGRTRLHDKGALDRQSRRVGERQPQRIAFAGEGDEAFDVVIAVRTLAADAQSQIDFGRRSLSRYSAQRMQGQAGPKPVIRRFRISCWSCRRWSRSLRRDRRAAFPRSSSTRPDRA